MNQPIPILILLWLGSIAACGDDDDDFAGSATIGAPCSNDSQCRFRCAEGSHYPGGMCTVPCSDDRDCPSGTACVDDEGGICAFTCDFDGHCGRFESSYRCDSTGRKGASGDIRVCRRP